MTKNSNEGGPFKNDPENDQERNKLLSFDRATNKVLKKVPEEDRAEFLREKGMMEYLEREFSKEADYDELVRAIHEHRAIHPEKPVGPSDIFQLVMGQVSDQERAREIKLAAMTDPKLKGLMEKFTAMNRPDLRTIKGDRE